MTDNEIFWGFVAFCVLWLVVICLLKRHRWKRHRAAWQIAEARKVWAKEIAPEPERSMPYQPPAAPPEEPYPTPICPEPPPPRKVRKRRPATVKQTKRLRAIKRRGKGKGA